MSKIKPQFKKLINATYFSFFIIFFFTDLSDLYANGLKKIAILPFEVNSEKDITHIKKGVEQMLSSRLYWEDKVSITDKRSLTSAIKNYKNLSEKKFLSAIAKKTKSDYILTGSITEFANSFR